MRAFIVGLLVVLTGCSGCSTMVPGAASKPPAAPTAAASAPTSAATTASADSNEADRAVCIDLDARGETAYNDFVVPMMTGAENVEVDIQRWTSAIASLKGVGFGRLGEASPEISDAATRLVASAEAFTIQDNANGTALLTAFVSLAAQCQAGGHKPSWFDAQRLQR